MRAAHVARWVAAGLAAASVSVAGCYLSHRRPEDAGSDAPLVDSPTRCGAASCSLVRAPEVRIEVIPAMPRLPERFEAVATGAAGRGDGLAIEIERPGDPRTLWIHGIGADIAEPLVLSGPLEVSLRDEVLVMRSDRCPGCDDGGVASRLLLAVVSGGLRASDLTLGDVTVEAAGMPCFSSGPSGVSGRHQLSFSRVGFTAVVDEGETRSLGDFSARVVRSSFECAPVDLPEPDGFEASTFVVYSIGPR